MAEPSKQITIERRGLMLVISSPSGAGKSTIARNLLEADPGLSLSVSVTTRQPQVSKISSKRRNMRSAVVASRLCRL